MALIRWNPGATRALSRWPDLWDDDLFPSMRTLTNTGLEVYETEKEVVVKANVAGVPDDKVEVTFEKGVLYITAEAEQEDKDEGKTHYSKNSWSYSYRVAVPGEIDHSAEPVAEVDNGVLTVTFQKSVQAQPRTLKVTRRQ